jgi:hypothetical protein
MFNRFAVFTTMLCAADWYPAEQFPPSQTHLPVDFFAHPAPFKDRP